MSAAGRTKKRARDIDTLDAAKRFRRINIDLRDTQTYPPDLLQWVLGRVGLQKESLPALTEAPSYLTREQVVELERMIEQHRRYLADEKKKELGVKVMDRETWTEEMDEWWRTLVRGEEAVAPEYLTEEEVGWLLLEARRRREFLEKKYPVT